jgi:hypothetical protein
VSLRELRVAFSETTDGDFEEALRLCPCNHRPEAARGADYYCEESERAKNISREKPASRHPSVQVLLLRT